MSAKHVPPAALEGSSSLRTQRLLSLALLLLFLLAAVPLLLLGRYCHPASDDFAYGTHTAVALREGQSLPGAVWYTIKRYYFGWQGTFSAAAAMSLVPSIWSESLYCLTPAVMLLTLSLGTFKLLDTLLRRFIGASRWAVVGLGSAMLLLSIELLPSPIESFYWWNGAVYYTFTYGIMLLFADRLLSLLLTERRIPVTMAAMVLAVYLGGNNYVTALLSTELCGLLVLYCIWKRQELLPHVLGIFAVLAAAFLVSALAPGNAVRQSELTGMGPLTAILWAIRQAAADCAGFASWPLILAVLLSVPLLWKLAERAPWAFRHPLPVQLLAFLVYASQNTPHFFAAGEVGPGRLRNIVFFSFLWLLLFSLFYWCGWLQRRHCHTLPGKYIKAAAVIVCVLLLCTTAFAYHSRTLTTAEAMLELQDGSARQFGLEQEARIAVYLDPSVRDAAVPPLTVRPKYLFWAELSPDIQDWANVAIRNYYQKDSVRLELPG